MHREDYESGSSERHHLANGAIYYGLGVTGIAGLAEWAHAPVIFDKYAFLAAAVLVGGGLVMRAAGRAFNL